MKLCEQIYKFRCEKKLSQAELAEALDVSRQSVSKWETGTAVPELSKLMLMSELFGVSLDELVKGRVETEKTSDRQEELSLTQVVYQRREGRITAGYFLIFFGGLVMLVLTALGGLLAGLVFSLPLFLCAVICFVCRRRAGLWCGWLLYWLVNVYLHFATGIGPEGWIRYFEFKDMTMHAVVSLIMFLAEIVMVVATVISFRNVRCGLSRKSVGLLCGGAVGYVTFRVLVSFGYMLLAKKISESDECTTFSIYSGIMRITTPLISMISVAAIAVMLIYLVALIRELRARRNK